MSGYISYPGDDAIIARIGNSRIDPPGFFDAPDYCPVCQLEIEDCEKGLGCIRCSVCNEIEGKCAEDCGFNEGCTNCPKEGHSFSDDCLLADGNAIRAEDLHLEEGREDDREDRE